MHVYIIYFDCCSYWLQLLIRYVIVSLRFCWQVNLCVKPGQKLGLMIRGGCEYGIGLYVTGVDANSAAEHAGLKVSAMLIILQ